MSFCLTTLAAGLAVASNLLAFDSFQAGEGGWQLAAPTVGNIDGDPDLEIVVAYRDNNGQWFLDAYKYTGARMPGFPYSGGFNPINVSPTLYDLDGDGQNEILFTAGASIVALRGNGSLLWKKDITVANYIPTGGFQAVTNEFYLTGLPLIPVPLLPVTAQFFSEVSPLIVVDLEGDGRKEVLTSWKIDPDSLSSAQDYNPFINDIFGLSEWGATGETWSGGVVVSDALTGENKFIYHFHQLVEAGLAVAQLDGDSAVEVLVLNDADSVAAFDKTQPPGLYGKGMLHKKFGKNLRLLSGLYQTGVDVHAADLDGDGLDEVFVSSTQIDPNWQPSESVLDDDGALLWREWKQPASITHRFGWFNSATLIPVNPDHDNHVDVLGFSQSPEISFRYWNGVQLVSHAGWPRSFAPDLPTPPVVGDVDGDGVEEIVICTYDPAHDPSSGQLFVFSLDGAQKYAVAIPRGVKHIPTIADVDWDGRTEVVLRALDGRVHILTFGNGGSTNISWATHRGNAQHDGNFGRNLYPAGTPLITSKSGGFRRTSFSWRVPEGYTPTAIRIFSATDPAGPFSERASLPGSAGEFTDIGLDLFRQYIYEIRAVYGDTVVSSAPLPITPEFENNLIVNGSFEQDDDSHWDKWFTGDIPWNNMIGSTESPHGGKQSMEIRLENHFSNSSITQYSHYAEPEDYLPVSPGTLYSFGGFIRTSGLTEDSQHWLEWDSSRTGESTNRRPPLPWPNYFTPAANLSNTAAPWVYLNRVFEMPEGFPNVELRHRFTTQKPVSGSVFIDDVFFRSLPPLNSWKEWIALGERWRHFTTTPPTDWFEPGFDDSAWPEAPAKFGAGSGPQNIVTPLPGYQPAYYFRRDFSATADSQELLLVATCTDDYGGTVYPLRLWINGTEAITSGIEAVSGEGNVEKYFDLSAFIHLIREGQNTIAVMLNNTWQTDWDNVAFDVSLRVILRKETPGNARAEILEIMLTPAEFVWLTLRATKASSWLLERSSDITANEWDVVRSVTFDSAETIEVTDSRSADFSRFYRLRRIL